MIFFILFILENCTFGFANYNYSINHDMVCTDQVVVYTDHDVIYKDHAAILKIE